MSNSTEKLEIHTVKKEDGTLWIVVRLKKYQTVDARFVPSFHDIHRIIQGISYCEDLKYPPPAKGRGRVAEFLRDAVYVRDFDVLAAKYQIPERDGDRIVDAHGAAVDTRHKQLLIPFTATDIRWGMK